MKLLRSSKAIKINQSVPSAPLQTAVTPLYVSITAHLPHASAGHLSQHPELISRQLYHKWSYQKETQKKSSWKKKKYSLHFTKTYLGSNSLMSRETKSRKFHLKPKFPAVISETTALWERKTQTVQLIWVFPSCFLRFGWHPILPSPYCFLSHFSSNCSFLFLPKQQQFNLLVLIFQH